MSWQNFYSILLLDHLKKHLVEYNWKQNLASNLILNTFKSMQKKGSSEKQIFTVVESAYFGILKQNIYSIKYQIQEIYVVVKQDIAGSYRILSIKTNIYRTLSKWNLGIIQTTSVWYYLYLNIWPIWQNKINQNPVFHIYNFLNFALLKISHLNS